MLLTLPPFDVTNTHDKTSNKTISLEESIYPQKYDADDLSVTSDHTEDTTSSTISNYSCDSDIEESLNHYDDKYISNEDQSQKTKRDSTIEKLFELFESGDLVSENDSIFVDRRTKALSLQGINNACIQLQNTAFKVVLLGYDMLNRVRWNGGRNGVQSKKQQDEMEIQFVYMIVDKNGRKSFVKSSKNLFPPLHQMPGCRLENMLGGAINSEKQIEIERKESSVNIINQDIKKGEEASNLCSEHLKNDNASQISTKQTTKYFSILKTFHSICTQLSRAAFLGIHRNISKVHRSSVAKDDNMVHSEEIEIQFEEIPTWEKQEYTKGSSKIIVVDTPPREKIDYQTETVAQAA